VPVVTALADAELDPSLVCRAGRLADSHFWPADVVNRESRPGTLVTVPSDPPSPDRPGVGSAAGGVPREAAAGRGAPMPKAPNSPTTRRRRRRGAARDTPSTGTPVPGANRCFFLRAAWFSPLASYPVHRGCCRRARCRVRARPVAPPDHSHSAGLAISLRPARRSLAGLRIPGLGIVNTGSLLRESGLFVRDGGQRQPDGEGGTGPGAVST